MQPPLVLMGGGDHRCTVVRCRKRPGAGGRQLGKRNGHLPAALVRPSGRAPGTARAGGCRPVRVRCGANGRAAMRCGLVRTVLPALRCDDLLLACGFCTVAERLVAFAWRFFKRWGAPDGGLQAAGSARMTHRTRESRLLPDADKTACPLLPGTY